MEAIETHIGGQQRLGVNIPEARRREMNDALSRRMLSFHKKAYRYLGNTADAEDAVQDALLSAYQHLDQFKGEAQMSTWLTAIVTNCSRMQLRKRPRQIHESLDAEFGGEKKYCVSERLADSAPSPEDECRASELRKQVLRFVAQLSPPLRKAFQLRELDGLTTSETAQALGVADGTVKAQLARARATIRRLMRRALDAKPSFARAN